MMMSKKTPQNIATESVNDRVVALSVIDRNETTTTLSTILQAVASTKNGLSKKSPKNRAPATHAGAVAISSVESTAVLDDESSSVTTSISQKSRRNPGTVNVPGLAQRQFPLEKFGGAHHHTTPTPPPSSMHQTVVTTKNGLRINRRARNAQHRMMMKTDSTSSPTNEDDESNHDGVSFASVANTTSDQIEEPSSAMTLTDNIDIEQPSPPVSNRHLVEAQVVQEESDDLERAEEVDPAIVERRASEEKKHKEFHRKGFTLLVFAIVVLLGAVLGSSLRYTSLVANKEASTSTGPTVPLPPMKNIELLYDELPEKTRESLGNKESPQYQAWKWLLNHPNLSTMEDWRKKQIFAMATFYYSFEGPNWPEHIRERWMDVNTSECSWVLTDAEVAYWGHQSDTHFSPAAYDHRDWEPCNEDGELQSIILSQLYLPTNVNPSFPPEVGLLTSLRLVGIVISEINAKISDLFIPELIQLPNLDLLTLHGIGISGSIPNEVALLTGLRHLLIGGNRLTGTIPPQIGKMTSLEYFSMTQMEGITGRLPSELGMLTRLTALEIVGNSLTGPIPNEMGHMTSIQKMWLGNNGLTGSIPSDLILMSNANALFLGNDLEVEGSRNNFSGSIPQELWELSKLQTLFLSNLPNLHGRIPTDSVMPNMVGLRLEGSPNLSGTIPEEICFLEKESLPPYTYAQGNALDFDCSDLLCGCDCACANGSSPSANNLDGWLLL